MHIGKLVFSQVIDSLPSLYHRPAPIRPYPWALFRSTESTVKLQTPLDLQGNIPTFIHISDDKLHDVNVLDLLIPEPGAFYIMDRGYVDFERLFSCTEQSVSSSSAPSPIPNTGVATLSPGTNPVVFDAIRPLR